MICKSCGSEIAENQKFCSHCGAEIKNETEISVAPVANTTPVANTAPAANMTPVAAPKEVKSPKTAFLFAILGSTVFGGIVGLVFDILGISKSKAVLKDDPENGLAYAAKVLSIISLIKKIIVIALLILYIVIFVLLLSTGAAVFSGLFDDIKETMTETNLMNIAGGMF